MNTTVQAPISIRKLNVHYGGHQALKDIDLDIPEKRITAMKMPQGIIASVSPPARIARVRRWLRSRCSAV